MTLYAFKILIYADEPYYFITEGSVGAAIFYTNQTYYVIWHVSKHFNTAQITEATIKLFPEAYYEIDTY